ncbi:hypothetical protein [Slackia piriformis]|uniref:hypothetical protein n=1 Tax=Slackia piriformis TaxID=626934 RepID=UPI002F91D59E
MADASEHHDACIYYGIVSLRLRNVIMQGFACLRCKMRTYVGGDMGEKENGDNDGNLTWRYD